MQTIDLSFIDTKVTTLPELRHALGFTKKVAIKALQELEAHGYINIVKSRTGKIKVFLTDKNIEGNQKIMEDF